MKFYSPKIMRQVIPVLILFAVMFSSLMIATSAPLIQVESVYMLQPPQLSPSGRFNAPYQLPKINPAGTLAAAVIDGGVQVWSVSAHDKPEKLIWNSLHSLKNSYVITFDWCGEQLMFSVIDSPVPITKERLNAYYSDEERSELDKFLQSPGRTLKIDIQSKQITVMLDTAYKVLDADRSGQLFAAQIPTTNSNDTALNFYKTIENKVEKVGYCDNLGQVFVFSWDHNSTGVFVLASVKTNASIAHQSLLFITAEGDKKTLLEENMSMAHPLVFTLSSKTPLELCLFVKYFEQVEALVSFDTHGVKERYRLFEAKSILKDVANTLQLIAVSPNGRFLFFQASPESVVDFDPGRHGDVWVVDIGNKHRRKIAKVGPIFETSAWSHSKLILSVGNGENEDVLQNWVLYCPGAE